MLYRLSEKFGWTPDEIRELDYQDVEAYLTILSLEAQLNKAQQGSG